MVGETDTRSLLCDVVKRSVIEGEARAKASCVASALENPRERLCEGPPPDIRYGVLQETGCCQDDPRDHHPHFQGGAGDETTPFVGRRSLWVASGGRSWGQLFHELKVFYYGTVGGVRATVHHSDCALPGIPRCGVTVPIYTGFDGIEAFHLGLVEAPHSIGVGAGWSTSTSSRLSLWMIPGS
jgi:hypothetical protein